VSMLPAALLSLVAALAGMPRQEHDNKASRNLSHWLSCRGRKRVV
jgi:hypothetical protein